MEVFAPSRAELTPLVYFSFPPGQYFLRAVPFYCFGFPQFPEYVFYFRHGPFMLCLHTETQHCLRGVLVERAY